MAVKYRHALDDGVGKVQDDIHGAAMRDIHGIQPRRMGKRDVIFGVGQEMHLMYVERMQLASVIHDTPMLMSTNPRGGHRTCIGRELAPIDVETVLVLRKR